MTFMIPGRSVQLEAVLREPHQKPLRGAVVLCHPHPQYGGTMDNRVVFRSAKAVVEAGMAALRFNFRGVEASSGSFDYGEGEQEDVAGALDWLNSRYQSLPLGLVGFSFGAWVGLQVACRDARVRFMTGIGLPLNFYDFDFLVENQKPALYIIGTNDEFCARERGDLLARRLPDSSSLRWVEGADHFFAAYLDVLQGLITSFVQDTEV